MSVTVPSGRQLVMDAVHHRPGPWVPYFAEFTINEKEKMSAYFGDSDFERKCDFSMETSVYGWFDEIRPGFFQDEFGVVWNRTVDKDIGVLDNVCIPDVTCHKDFSFPEPLEAKFRAVLDDFTKHDHGKCKTVDFGFTLFERAWTLLTIEETLTAMVLEPEALEELMDRCLEYNLRLIDIALSYDNVDMIHFGDDWGQQKGLIMGASYWRRFIKPRLAQMYARVKSAGKLVSQHSCGDIAEVFPDLIDMGLDVYQTFQPEIYDIEAVKREYGKDLTFWGGISTQQLLPTAPPEVVRSETERIIGVMAQNGGYIASPTHAVPGDVPAENIEAMLDVFVKHGKGLSLSQILQRS